MKNLILSIILLSNFPAIAGTDSKGTLEMIARCLSKHAAQDIHQCVKPEFSASVSEKKIAEFSMFVSRFNSMEGIRECTTKDIQKFPMESITKEALCADFKNGKTSKLTVWKMIAKNGKYFVEDLKSQ